MARVSGCPVSGRYFPWHFWQWNLKTGECAHDPTVKTRCYEVKVEGENVLVAV